MIVSRISPTAKLIADRYQDIFGDRGIPYSMLSLLIVMTLCGFPSLSEFVRFCAFSRSVSSLSRAIGKSDKELVNRARRRHALSVLKRVRTSPDNWIWAVDTTSNKQRTKGLEGGGKWANSKDEIFEGQNMMIIAAVNKKTGQTTPVAWRPCLKAAERKINTNHDLVVLMLKELLGQQWPKLTVVMDSWFDSAELLQGFSEMGLTYVVQLKSSRLAKFYPSPRHSRFKLKELFQGMKKKGALSFTRENAIPEFTPVTKMTFCLGNSSAFDP